MKLVSLNWYALAQRKSSARAATLGTTVPLGARTCGALWGNSKVSRVSSSSASSRRTLSCSQRKSSEKLFGGGDSSAASNGLRARDAALQRARKGRDSS